MKKPTIYSYTKAILLFFASVFFCHHMLAQDPKFLFDLQAGAGISMMPFTFPDNQQESFFYKQDYQDNPAFSFSAGAHAAFNVFEYTYLESGLKVLFIQGRDTGFEPIYVAGGRIYTYTTRATFIGIPTVLRIQAEKIGLRLGIQHLFFLHASGKKSLEHTPERIAQFNLSDEVVISEEDLHFNNYQRGALLGLSYTVSKDWAIQAEVYIGNNNLFREEDYSEEWTRKIRQFTLGIQYKL